MYTLILGFQSSFSTITVEPTQPITVVVNLIITLCRGSKSISHVCFYYNTKFPLFRTNYGIYF